MIRILFKYLLFSVMFVLLLWGSDRLLTYGLKLRQHDDFGVWNRLVRGEINAQILITGDSRAIVGYDSQIIGSFLNMNAFNLAIDGAPPNIQIPWLKTYLKHNQPPAILLQSLNRLNTGDDIYNPRQYFPYLHETEIYNAYKPMYEGLWKHRYIPLYSFALYKASIFDALEGLTGKERIKTNYQRINGFRPSSMSWNNDFDNFVKQFPDGIYYPVEQEAVENMREVIALASEHGIQLIFVYPPVYHENNRYWLNRAEIMDAYESLANKYDVPLLDFTDLPINYDKSYFYNSSHLNARGAEIFSKTLAVMLTDLDASESESLISGNAATVRQACGH